MPSTSTTDTHPPEAEATWEEELTPRQSWLDTVSAACLVFAMAVLGTVFVITFFPGH